MTNGIRTRLISEVDASKIGIRGAVTNLPDEVDALEPPDAVGEPYRGNHV